PQDQAHARVVQVAGARKDLEYPQVLRSEPVLRETIAQHRTLCGPLESLARADGVFLEGLPPGAEILVVISLGRHLVSACGHLAHQFRCGIGDPAEDKECGTSATFIEEIQGSPSAR